MSRRAVAALVAVVLAAVAYRVLFPDRFDYAGHFVAGAGGTLCLLAPFVRRGGPWRVVTVAAVAVLLGVGTESTIFRLAEFDPVDLANQSLGALLVCAGFVDAEGVRDAALAAAAGVTLLIAGFGLVFA